MQKNKKVIVFGLDGFTWKTIDYLQGQFEFRNIQKFRSESAWGRLKSTIPPSTIPAWVSFATGCNPGKHGVFDFICPDGSLKKLKVNSSSDIKVKTIQQIIEDAGKKSIVINLPLSTPAKTKGITVGSFMSAQNELFHPPEIAKIPEIRAYRIAEVGEAAQDEKAYLSDVNEGAQIRINAVKRLFREDWDYFFVMFSETDFMQHAVFDQIKNGKLNSAYKEKIFSIYQKLDNCFGWFMENKGEDCYLILMSDHGFDTYEYCFSLLRFLEENGLLEFKKAKKLGGNLDWEQKAVWRGAFRLDISPVVNLLNRRQLGRMALDAARDIYLRVGRIVPIAKWFGIEGHTLVPDPEKSRAMPIVRYGYSAYINSAARFKDGNVEETEQMRDEIIKKLKGIRSSFTKKSPFRFVLKSEEVYEGEYVGDAPDIIIGLADHAIVGAGNFGSTFAKIRKNYHDDYGIFAIQGREVKKGFMGDKNIVDIAPTVLDLLGIDIPDHVDGKPIVCSFQDSSKKTQNVGKR